MALPPLMNPEIKDMLTINPTGNGTEEVLPILTTVCFDTFCEPMHSIKNSKIPLPRVRSNGCSLIVIFMNIVEDFIKQVFFHT